MSQAYTIQAITNRNKKDKFSNDTYTVKFAEHAEAVYAAFKTEPKVGDQKYGDIIEGEFGGRFKSAQKPDFEPHTSNAPSQPSSEPRKSDSERSDDIRWGLCIKEANAYVIQNRPDLSPNKWATEVTEYANALYEAAAKPTSVAAQESSDITPSDEEADQQIDLSGIPF